MLPGNSSTVVVLPETDDPPVPKNCSPEKNPSSIVPSGARTMPPCRTVVALSPSVPPTESGAAGVAPLPRIVSVPAGKKPSVAGFKPAKTAALAPVTG